MILIGAQAKNGCLFVTIPDHPKFGSLSDRDVERVFKYLVGLARFIYWIISSLERALCQT